VAQQIESEKPRRRMFYPWEEWTNGSTWSATRGDDFTCTVLGFQNALHQRARAYGMKVTTGSPRPDVVEFRFTRNDGTD
jgi:hypothetical protein